METGNGDYRGMSDLIMKVIDAIRDMSGRITDLASLVRDLIRTGDRDSLMMQSDIHTIRDLTQVNLRKQLP